MEFRLDRKSPLGLKDQLKGQIRILVETGELSPGQALPPAREMAALLNLNRNTVAAAYQDLGREGVLHGEAGRGTFVAGGRMTGRTGDLKRIFDQAVAEALDSGFSPEQITDFMLNRAATCFPGPAGRRVLVVECNRETLDDLTATLRAELGVEAAGALIQDLEAQPERAAERLAGVDLVVCGFNHVEELLRVAPDCPVEVVGVMYRSDVSIMNELLRLPAGTRVGFTCANQRSTESLYKEVFLASGSSLVKMWAGLDRPEEVQRLVDQCQVIFATAYVFDRISRMVGPDKRVVRVELSLDPANVKLIRERLSLAPERGRTGEV